MKPGQRASEASERYPGSRYADQVTALVSGFEFETCEACGLDLDRHAIAPDMLGNAQAFCVTEALSDAIDAIAETED